jgi:hypothetical protein
MNARRCLKCIRCRAGQGATRNLPKRNQARPRRRQRAAIDKTTVLPKPRDRWRNGRTATLDPAHRVGIIIELPAHVGTSAIGREYTVFAGICRQFMNCKADRLTVHGNAGADQVGKVGQLDPHQILDVIALPSAFDQKALISRKRLGALSEGLNKALGRSLAAVWQATACTIRVDASRLPVGPGRNCIMIADLLPDSTLKAAIAMVMPRPDRMLIMK